jgi:hypothetical protein
MPLGVRQLDPGPDKTSVTAQRTNLPGDPGLRGPVEFTREQALV